MPTKILVPPRISGGFYVPPRGSVFYVPAPPQNILQTPLA